MAFGLFDPLLVAIVVTVLGCLFWRYQWRLGQPDISQSPNPTEENLILHPIPTDTTIAPEIPPTNNITNHLSPSKEHEHDRLILCEYTWALYKSLPSAIQDNVEPAVLKKLLAMCSDVSLDACSALLKDEPHVRALLLQGWEKGTFEALRSDQKFLLLSKPAEHDDGKISSRLSSKQPEDDISTAETDVTGEEGISSSRVDSVVEATSSPLMPKEVATVPKIRDSEEVPSKHEDEGSLRNRDAPGASDQRSDANLTISKSTLTAGRDIHVAVAVWQITNTSPDDHKIASWFFDVVDYRATHNEIAKKRSKSTGGWFLQSKTYTEWSGVGKTVMASLVVDHLRTFDETDTFVGIIYLNYKLRSQQSKLAIFGAFCRQIYEFCQDPALKALYDSHEKRKSHPTEIELRSALSTAFQHYQSCYLILDALDEYTAEYSDKQVREVINDILALGPNVKLFITSRILGEMKATFRELGAAIEEIVGDDKDMRAYVAERVAILKSKLDFEVSENFSEHIVEKVLEAAKGRFLVAELGMNLLAEQLNLGELEDALDKLPNEIDDTYIRVIQLIKTYPEGRRKLAMTALMWIAHARRRLTVRELQHALATKHGRNQTDKYVTPLSTITGLCAGLIVVENNGWHRSSGGRILRFVHFTTQEFFEKSQLEDLSDAHKEMFSTCIEYLTIAGNHILPMGFTWASVYSWERSSHLPFYDYSALNWGHHANTHHESLREEVDAFLFQNHRALDLSWEYTADREYRDREFGDREFGDRDDLTGNGGSGIFLAAYHDQIRAPYLVLDQMDVFPRTKKQRTPLHIAVIAGWTNAVEEMLRWSGSRCGDNISPSSHNSTMRWCGDSYAFLENVRDEYGRTALSYAAEDGRELAAKLLLEHRSIEVDSKDNNGRTPFSHAARRGHEPLMELLLEHGDVDVNSEDNEGLTPFWYAVHYHSLSSVELLWAPSKSINISNLPFHSRGANVDSKDTNGRTSLSYAAELGWDSVVKALLEHGGVEVDSKDNSGRTPFSYAIERGEESVAKLLLEHGGIDVDSKDNNGRTPFSYAAHNGQESVLKLLYEQGVQVDAKDSFGWTPLAYAVKMGHQSTVKALLEHGDAHAEEHFKHSRRILCNYLSTPYGRPPGIRQTMDPVVLKNLLIIYYDTSADACSALFENESNVQALILQSWEKGASRALHSDQSLRLLSSKPVEHGTLIMASCLQKEPSRDIEECIKLLQEALESRSPPHPDRSGSLNDPATALSTRFQRTGAFEDLDECIRLHREALSLVPPEHPGHSTPHNNLVGALITRFKLKGVFQDLEECIQLLQKALKSRPPPRVPPDRYQTCPWLGRFKSVQAFAAFAWTHRPAASLNAYLYALELLPLLASVYPELVEQRGVLEQSRELIGNAAQCAIHQNQFETAFVLLSTSRSLFSSQGLQPCTPVDELTSVNPILAKRYRDLSKQLEQASHGSANHLHESPASDQQFLDQPPFTSLSALAVQRCQAIEEIRMVPGFEGFLSPPSFPSLQHAAQNGPVVLLNVSEHGCDALIMHKSDPVEHVALSDVSPARLEALKVLFDESHVGESVVSRGLVRNRSPVRNPLLIALGLLWINVVQPVVKALALQKTHSLSRIWWCPSGAFTYLPIHAAGMYSDDYEPIDCLFQYAVSSYCTSPQDLLHHQPQIPSAFKMTAIIEPKAHATNPPHGTIILPLPGTLDELDHIYKHIPDNGQLIARLGSEVAPNQIEVVVPEIQQSSIVHFACHCMHDLDKPLESYFQLSGGRLTMSRIIKECQVSDSTALAFLSACGNAVGDNHQPDESVNLVAMMMLAGFRSVIGSMGPVIDSDAPIVVDVVYGHLFRNGKDAPPDVRDAAYGLHLATQKLREEGRPLHSWVPYVHYGI